MKAIFCRALLCLAGTTALLLNITPAVAGNSLMDLDEYHGKVVVVDFWASWCTPCRRSFPWLNDMHRKYHDQGLVIIGVNMDTDPKEAEAFLQEYPASFRIVRDPDGILAHHYDVIAMPSSYVINRQGDVVVRQLGFKTALQHEYESALLETLRQDELVGRRDAAAGSQQHHTQ